MGPAALACLAFLPALLIRDPCICLSGSFTASLGVLVIYESFPKLNTLLQQVPKQAYLRVGQLKSDLMAGRMEGLVEEIQGRILSHF